MKTIKDELVAIALVCKTSEEFEGRAKTYLKDVKGVNQPFMNDAELRELFRKANHEAEVKKAWEVLDKVIKPMLYKRPEVKGLWYEVWIDLDENWLDKWFSSFRYMDNVAIVEVCVKYLNDRERFYSSPDYYDMLNKLVADL